MLQTNEERFPDSIWKLKLIMIGRLEELFKNNEKWDLAPFIIQAYDNLLRKKILVKSDLEYKLLEAHDSIRKMMNKPVYYGLGNIDSFSDVIKTIDVAKEDYDINLTALDVENINSDFGAYNDIGRKHGVSAEVVYFIKANFR